MAYRSFSVLSSLALGLVLAACAPPLDFAELATRRLIHAEQATGPVVVGVIWPDGEDLFREGIELALTEINASPEQVLGQPLEVRYVGEEYDFDETRPLVRNMARDLDVVSVIGHRGPEVAIPASIIYERSGILYMAPFITNRRLTAHRFQMVFRMVPDNALLADQLVALCDYLDFSRLVVLSSRNPENREQMVLFLDRALHSGLSIDTQVSFFDNTRNFRDVLARFRNHQFDAIFIAGNDTFGGRLVRQIRELGMDQPIIGVDTMDSAEFLAVAGEAAEGVILPTVYYAAAATNINEQFVTRFEERFGVAPDVYAAQAYDSLNLLVHVIRRSRSRVPVILASTLRFIPYWVGVTGVHAFDFAGNVQGKKYYFKARRGGRWEILVGAHTAYTVQRFLDFLDERNETGGPGEPEVIPSPTPPAAPRELP